MTVPISSTAQPSSQGLSQQESKPLKPSTVKWMGRKAKMLLSFAWWVSICALPLLIFNLVNSIFAAIGCPATGDCYLPGAFNGVLIQAVSLALLVLVWPVALFKLVAKIKNWND